MNLIEQLGEHEKAKKYLAWMKRENLMMGSYQIQNGRASFYIQTLESAIVECEAGKRLEVGDEN